MHLRLVVAGVEMAWVTSSCMMGQQKDCHASEYSAAPLSLSLKVSICEWVNAHVSATHMLLVIGSLVIFASAEKADEQKGELWRRKEFNATEGAASEWSASE